MTGEQASGTNVRRSHINDFTTSVGQHVRLNINMGFAQVWRKKILIGEDALFHAKEFRTAFN